MAEVTYLEAIREGLPEEMERDERVFCSARTSARIGGAFKVTDGLQQRFGEHRVIDTPISEAAIVGAAAGAAHMGMRPVCEMQFIDFISCAYDILTNYVATARYRAGPARPDGRARAVRRRCAWRPVSFAEPGGGVPAHARAQDRLPGDARDAKGLIKSAIRDDDPVLYLRAQVSLPAHQGRAARREIRHPDRQGTGRARGPDLSIITYCGDGLEGARGGGAAPREDGLSVEVIDLRTLAADGRRGHRRHRPEDQPGAGGA